ncbi:MAG: sterol desaturase family protein [Gammaproteobacteria bacterium]|jgi:sterol desaturase/sphingolipid hydroxylase (fatty acid hydroxylase superfamily)|nr:sterol desaturase family protein [Gammaproteobacteria bacterium]
MPETVSLFEPVLRLGSFALALAVLAAAEALAPRRRLTLDRLIRWPGNLGIGMLNTFVVRLLLPASAVGFAALLEQEQVGLFNISQTSPVVAGLLAFVALDFTIYLQHRALHHFPLLWRMHRMHHVDADVDVSTALRFHPIEIVFSLGVKLIAIALLGAPAAAVLAFEVVLNVCAMFNHSNIALPLGLDRALRLAVVTPDMHRIHHSVRRVETDSNFGFNLSVWDRLLGTYTDAPADGQEQMITGLPGYAPAEGTRIHRMLADPLEGERN